MRSARYVIVVHGIGEQRKYETILPVINRFAEARGERVFGEPLTLGILASHLAQQDWIEFEGIPLHPYGQRGEVMPFVGRIAEHGEHLRFVDLHWADIMKGQFGKIGLPLNTWLRSLLDRLDNRQAPPWIADMLRTMRTGILPLQKLLSSRLPGLSDEIFNRFLGDVQLYGEYAATRGKAVRRFHDRLETIHNHHRERGETVGFTVIAHSLGSILAFDALMLAHMARPDSSDPKAAAQGQRLRDRFTDYQHEPQEKPPDLEWIKSVDSLVTLGSPIDKFLVLWWLNYGHLCTTDWMEPELVEHRKNLRLRHYNYCDEQDPVGHELDVAYTSTAVQAIFGLATKDNRGQTVVKPDEEVVFTRYARPGMAHVDYWEDGDLFKRILHLAIDGKDPSDEAAQKVAWFRLGSYIRALFWSYLLVPVIGWVAATASLIWTVKATETWKGRFTGASLTMVILGFTLWLMALLVQWRQVLVSKRKPRSGKAWEDGAQENKRRAPTLRLRAVARGAFRASILVLPFVWGLLFFYQEWVLDLCSRAGETLGRVALRYCGSSIVNNLLEISALKLSVGKLGDLGTLFREAALVPVRIGLAVAFLLALWNLAVFLRMKFKWNRPGMRVFLDFMQYSEEDPTRPTESVDLLDGEST